MSRPSSSLTPMMEQYLGIKAQHRDRILLYRMGDFYETFFDDAVTASRVLGITLTTRGKSRGEPVPLAGVPHHSVNSYIHRLIRAGFSVAICEQVEDPAQAKGVVKREVTEVITPGTVAIEEFLPSHQGAYCLALMPEEDRAGFVLGDISTGELLAGQDHPAQVLGLPARYRVREIIYPEDREGSGLIGELKALYPDLHFQSRSSWDFHPDESAETLRSHFAVASVETLGIRDDETLLSRSLGGLIAYLRSLKSEDLSFIDRISFLRQEETMALDRLSVENLELMDPLRGEDRSATLFGVIDRTVTGMGARRLSRWLLTPLVKKEAIEERQDAVERLKDDRELRRELQGQLRQSSDLERLVGRLSALRARPRDLKALAETLALLPPLKVRLIAEGEGLLRQLGQQIDMLEPLRDLLQEALVDELPATMANGGVIRDGFDEELDRLRSLSREGRGWILAQQESEREKTGIANLKIGYNRVFGYYIEVSRGQLEKVPEHYMAKQTLTGSQRYVTPALKEREEEILNAEDNRLRRERDLFEELRERAWQAHDAIQDDGRVLSELDAFCSMAAVAEERRYCRPEILDEPLLEIREGRHPVVEALLSEEYIPNDLRMDPRGEQILLLTGPNMGGKSTYLRMAALVVLMAQMGSFVPAKAARLGLVDKIFTRVGASDNLARGQSTFLIEMEETAYILRNLTGRSLVLMDEIGRGTSTYDGLSLAWAVLEHLHGDERLQPKTLFATHYHELTQLSEKLPRLRNCHVTVKEWQDQVVFLRRVEEGAAGRSYGIQVARLAGLPRSVTDRAMEILEDLESRQAGEELRHQPESRRQLDLFGSGGHPLLEEIRNLDPERLTPLEALSLLSDYREKLQRRKGDL